MKEPTRLQTYLTPSRRKHLSKVWVGITIIYDIIRALIVAKTFSKYGIHTGYYLCFEFVISVLFALASLRLVLAMVDKDRNKTIPYFFITSLLFFAPEIYIIIFGDHIPGHLFLIFGVYLSITFTISLTLLIRDAHIRRREKLMVDSFDED